MATKTESIMNNLINCRESQIQRDRVLWSERTLEKIEAGDEKALKVFGCYRNSVLQGEYGFNGLSMTVPCVLCKEGIEQIKQIPLNEEERAGLERSAQTLKPYMQYVEDKLGLQPAKSLA